MSDTVVLPEVRIYSVRGYPVMLDSDLARMYQVETKILKKAVRRNLDRFPLDFMFEPTRDELELLRFQFGTLTFDKQDSVKAPIACEISKNDLPQTTEQNLFRFQFGTLNLETDVQENSSVGNPSSIRSGYFNPFFFTEIGVGMLSSVLNSERAVQVNISIMRLFAQVRARMLMNQIDLAPKLESLQRELAIVQQKLDRLSAHDRISIDEAMPKQNNVKMIQDRVARYFGLGIEELKSQTRTKAVVLARQIAIFLIRENLPLGLSEIGNHFGQRDHTTILHACQKIRDDSAGNEFIRRAIAFLQNELQPIFA